MEIFDSWQSILYLSSYFCLNQSGRPIDSDQYADNSIAMPLMCLIFVNSQYMTFVDEIAGIICL